MWNCSNLLKVILLSLVSISFQLIYSQDINKTNVWQIVNPKSNVTSYIVATMHSNDRDLFYFSDSVLNIMKSVENYCFETDFSGFQSNYEFFKSEKDFDRKNIRNFNIIIDSKEYGYPHFMDYHFYEFAKNNQKNIFYFESILKQDSILKIMNSYYNDMDNSQIDFLLKEQYIKSNMDSLNYITYNFYRNNLEMYRLIFSNRNIDMVKTILNNRQSTVYFIGAGHIVGDLGVLELLKKYHYGITPIVTDNCSYSNKCFNEKIISKSQHSYIDSNFRFSVNFSSYPEINDAQEGELLYYYSDLAQGNRYAVRVSKEMEEDEEYGFLRRKTSKEYVYYNNYQVAFDKDLGFCYKKMIKNNGLVYEVFTSGGYLFMNSNRPKIFFDSFRVW